MSRKAKSIVAALYFGCFACESAVAGAQPSDAPVVVGRGVVSAGGEKDGQTWFEFDRVDQHFVLDDALVADPQAVFAVLQNSSDSGRSVVIRYDINSGIFDPDASKPSYVVRELVYDGRTVGGQVGSTKRMPDTTTLGKAQSLLARGVALHGADDDQGAISALNEALAGGALSGPRKALALKTLGRATDDLAFLSCPPGAKRDKLLMAALAAFQSWQALSPDDADAASEAASALSDLDAYGEALKAYRAAADKWPEKSFWPLIRLGAIHRTLGDNAAALAALDEITAKGGQPIGMAYHYHRGWTLNDLGRFDEAIVEFTAGIKEQPDYAWAFAMRSCAFASLGRLDKAAADQDQAIGLMRDDLMSGTATDAQTQDINRAMAVADQLRAAKARDEHAKIDGLCRGYVNRGDEKRDRSPLLPVAP
jgi:tetratricopeptide (TPR) repeat protein